MARLLAYTSTTPGHVFPPVGMLLELRTRGHEIHVRTQVADVDRLGALGFEAAPVDPRIEEIEFDDWRARSQISGQRRIISLYQEVARLEIPHPQKAGDEPRPPAAREAAGRAPPRRVRHGRPGGGRRLGGGGGGPAVGAVLPVPAAVPV